MSRGRLRIHLGAAPGVGKTYAMLDEARRRHERGTDVVVAYADARGRSRTAAMLRDLEIVPRRTEVVGGVEVQELDLDAVLARRPAVAVVDDLGHRNPAGSRHRSRHEDVEELLAHGIDVLATVGIESLESLQDVVERIIGERPSEVVPDEVVRGAEQVELVDMTPEALRRRIVHGNVVPADEVDAALDGRFRPDTLAALRELALLWVADQVDETLHDHDAPQRWETKERVVVALTGAADGRPTHPPGGPAGAPLDRRAARGARATAQGGRSTRPPSRSTAACCPTSAVGTTRSWAPTCPPHSATSPAPATPPSWCSAPPAATGGPSSAAARWSTRSCGPPATSTSTSSATTVGTTAPTTG